MSATPSAGALRAAERIYGRFMNWRARNAKAEQALAEIIHEETQAETAGLVAALKSAHSILAYLIGEESKKGASVASIYAQAKVAELKAREALAKIGEGAK